MIHIENKIKYELNQKTKTATVKTNVLTTLTSVQIPATISVHGEIYTVNKIGKKAFKGSKWLDSIRLPHTVVVIDEEAFSSCERLFWVVIAAPEITIKTWAFESCKKLTQWTARKVFLDGTQIFFNCVELKSISKKAIFELKVPRLSFCHCKKLKKLKLGDFVDVDGSSFRGCSVELFFEGDGAISNDPESSVPVSETITIKCPETSNLVNYAFDGWKVELLTSE